MDAIISYTSRSLSKTEAHYSVHKLEFLALKWAVVKKFHECLYGSTFNIYTDSNPLTYILTTMKLNAVSHHWVASLANYKFWLHYRVGKTNINADALSRVSWPNHMTNTTGMYQQVTATVVQAVEEATLRGPVSCIKAYKCNLCILDPIKDS